MTDDVSRIWGFDRETLALAADEMVAIPEGWVVRTPSLSRFYNLNRLIVTVPIEVEAASALAERYLGGLTYRKLSIADEASGERLRGELAEWKFERDVVMALTGEPDRGVDTSDVIEVGEGEALELMGQWVGESEEPLATQEVVEGSRRIWRARNARRFGILGRDGKLAGMTMLFSDGRVAQVEDVFVVRGERGRGLGRRLVTHATVEALDAGHELTWIGADDRDWPKDLYASVGFEAVGRSWQFHQPVD